MFDFQNFIVSSIMFYWVRQSNEWCSIGFDYWTVRLDNPGTMDPVVLAGLFALQKKKVIRKAWTRVTKNLTNFCLTQPNFRGAAVLHSGRPFFFFAFFPPRNWKLWQYFCSLLRPGPNPKRFPPHLILSLPWTFAFAGLLLLLFDLIYAVPN